MLQIVRDALRHRAGFFSIDTEGCIHGAIAGSEHRIGGIILIFRIQQNPKSGGMLYLIIAIAGALAIVFLAWCVHSSVPFPSRL